MARQSIIKTKINKSKGDFNRVNYPKVSLDNWYLTNPSAFFWSDKCKTFVIVLAFEEFNILRNSIFL